MNSKTLQIGDRLTQIELFDSAGQAIGIESFPDRTLLLVVLRHLA